MPQQLQERRCYIYSSLAAYDTEHVPWVFCRWQILCCTGVSPRLDEIRLCVLTKWTWINGGIDLPEAHTLFYLHFVVAQQPVDDFQCLGELMLGRPLDIMCVVKAPQRPDTRITGRRHRSTSMQKAVVLVEQVLFAVSSVRSTRGIGQSSYAGTPIDFN